MADGELRPEGRDRREDLLVPDNRVVSLDEARKEKEAPRRRRTGVGRENDLMYRSDVEELVKAGVGGGMVALGSKVYEQMSGEIAEYIDGMEERLWQRMQTEMYRRSVRGRLRGLLIRLGAVPRAQLERTVDAVDVLDPNVHAAAAAHSEEDGS